MAVQQRFFRGGIACEIERTPDGWAWQALLGVDRASHPLVGVGYVPRAGGASSPLMRVTRSVSGNAALDEKWWFTFDPAHPGNFDDVLAETQSVADWLSAFERSDLEEQF